VLQTDFKTMSKIAKSLSKEYPYKYSDIRQLQKECKLTDKQLKEVVEAASVGYLPLTAVLEALLGFKNCL